MDTQNIENGRTGVHVLDGKIPRASRCRRAALSNVTNIGLPVAVLKKSKKSQSHCPKQQVVTSLDKESYTEDIVRYLLEKEKEHCICVNYMDKQPDLKPAMRSILVDWIIQACTKFKVTDETQYYVVQYVDRFLSSELIERSNLQLVGICAIFLASKFEEISVPTMSDLCYITEDTYTPKVNHQIIYTIYLQYQCTNTGNTYTPKVSYSHLSKRSYLNISNINFQFILLR